MPSKYRLLLGGQDGICQYDGVLTCVDTYASTVGVKGVGHLPRMIPI
ncbi:hypothetical protein [Methyloglobulus sp.]